MGHTATTKSCQIEKRKKNKNKKVGKHHKKLALETSDLQHLAVETRNGCKTANLKHGYFQILINWF